MNHIGRRLLCILAAMAVIASPICGFAEAAEQPAALPPLSVSGRGFQSDGAPFFLLGANLDANGDATADLQELADSGINAVRVAIKLEDGAEKAAAKLKATVSAAKAAGLYTIPVLAPAGACKGAFDESIAAAALTTVARAVSGEEGIAYFELRLSDTAGGGLTDTEQQWRNIVISMVQAVKAQDPARLCLVSSMDSGKNNTGKNVVWLTDSFCDGMSFDAKSAVTEAKLDSYDSFYLPLLSVDYPVVTACEAGEPAMTAEELEQFLMEAYANGIMAVTTNFSSDLRDVYQKMGAFFQQAGEVRGDAEVGILQSAYAVDAPHGVNLSVDHAAQIFRTFHLRPVMYQSDLRFIDTGFSQTSEGTETVSDVVLSVHYKGVIADGREINREVISTLQKNGIPVLEKADIAQLTEREAADFLESCGVQTDSKTEPGVQYVRTANGLAAFGKPADSQANRIYPVVGSTKLLRVTDTEKQVLFEGSAAELAQQGLPYAGSAAVYLIAESGEDAPVVVVDESAFAAFADGVKIKAEALQQDGGVFFPLRLVAEQFGAAVTWNGELRRAEVLQDGRKTCITPGEVVYESDGVQYRAAAAAYLPSDTMFAPPEMIGAILGMRYQYDTLTNSMFFYKLERE